MKYKGSSAKQVRYLEPDLSCNQSQYQAMEAIRSLRPGSVETRAQEESLLNLDTFVNQSRGSRADS